MTIRGRARADGVIDDTFRIQLMEEHLVQLHRAIADGANCFGVHQWTFIDNWSWINAFKRRYGFWRLDLETGERQINAMRCGLPNWRPATVLPAINSALRQRSLSPARKGGAREVTPVRLY